MVVIPYANNFIDDKIQVGLMGNPTFEMLTS